MLLRVIIYVLIFQVTFLGLIVAPQVPSAGEAAFLAVMAVLFAIVLRTVVEIVKDIEGRRRGDAEDVEPEDDIDTAY